MKLIIDIPENKIDDCKLEVSFIGQEGWMYSPKQNWIINKENGVELDDLDIKSYIANGTPLQAELEEIKAEINEYLIASFADDEDFRWFNLCLDSHIKEIDNE